MDQKRHKISVIAKARNEEQHIDRCLTSALAACAGHDLEVILADGGSTDRTVEIASALPVQIVSLAHPAEACCGIGPQMGFQHATGDYICLIDGDMELDPAFVPHAIERLGADPRIAGVAGTILEMNQDNFEFRRRAARPPRLGFVDHLSGGGVFRRVALEEIGYFTDRNLCAFEELDLGLRLQNHGWLLERISTPAVKHFGHSDSSFAIIVRRWKSGYAFGSGQIVRAAFQEGYLVRVLASLRDLWLWAAVLLWWIILAGIWFLPLDASRRAVVFFVILLLPFILMTIRKRSFGVAALSVTAWCVNTAGMLVGLLRPRKDPRAHIATAILK